MEKLLDYYLTGLLNEVAATEVLTQLNNNRKIVGDVEDFISHIAKVAQNIDANVTDEMIKEISFVEHTNNNSGVREYFNSITIPEYAVYNGKDLVIDYNKVSKGMVTMKELGFEIGKGFSTELVHVTEDIYMPYALVGDRETVVTFNILDSKDEELFKEAEGEVVIVDSKLGYYLYKALQNPRITKITVVEPCHTVAQFVEFEILEQINSSNIPVDFVVDHPMNVYNNFNENQTVFMKLNYEALENWEDVIELIEETNPNKVKLIGISEFKSYARKALINGFVKSQNQESNEEKYMALTEMEKALIHKFAFNISKEDADANMITLLREALEDDKKMDTIIREYV